MKCGIVTNLPSVSFSFLLPVFFTFKYTAYRDETQASPPCRRPVKPIPYWVSLTQASRCGIRLPFLPFSYRRSVLALRLPDDIYILSRCICFSKLVHCRSTASSSWTSRHKFGFVILYRQMTVSFYNRGAYEKLDSYTSWSIQSKPVQSKSNDWRHLRIDTVPIASFGLVLQALYVSAKLVQQSSTLWLRRNQKNAFQCLFNRGIRWRLQSSRTRRTCMSRPTTYICWITETESYKYFLA